MTADEAIAIRKSWVRAIGPVRERGVGYNGPWPLPASTVVASHDWLAYVNAMAEQLPGGVDLDFPSTEDVRWAWPQGISIVFSEPLDVEHVIVSRDSPSGGIVAIPPKVESQVVRGLTVGPLETFSALVRTGAVTAITGYAQEGDQETDILAYPMAWIGEDPGDAVTGRWLPGMRMHALHTERVSHASRLLLSVVSALGHRLTRLDAPVTANRGERRRIHRDLPGLRVLNLSTGATVSKTEGSGSVEWQRRWMVRGHWRLQPYGPQKSLRKPIWIDPYVKGPEDKPLDVRPTVWRATAPQKGV